MFGTIFLFVPFSTVRVACVNKWAKKNAREGGTLSPRVPPSRAFFLYFTHLFPSACYAGYSTCIQGLQS